MPPVTDPDSNPTALPCRVCAGQVVEVLSAGSVPVCNRLLSDRNETELRHPLTVGFCRECGLLQLVDPISAEMLVPPTKQRYTEPEVHLDELADFLRRIPGLPAPPSVCGVTEKDASLVRRLARTGAAKAVCLDARRDWGIDDERAGIETLQARIAQNVPPAGHAGAYDIVIARHVLEHAHDFAAFLRGLAGLLAPSGYLVVEVPDFTSSLVGGDYSTLWEEHVSYFTPLTLRGSAERVGFQLYSQQVYHYVPEDSLVCVLTQRTAATEDSAWSGLLSDVELVRQRTIAEHYGRSLPSVRQRWQQYLAQERERGRTISLLGAGHLGLMFMNLLDLSPHIDLVLDDAADKRGRFTPGSRLPIQEVAAMETTPSGLCLLSVSPEGESRVLASRRDFLANGGRFASIFPTSPLACFPKTK